MDYRFTDTQVDPPGAADMLSTERLIRLDPCAWCYSPPMEDPDVNPSPAHTERYITFGSFNILAKLSDDTLDLWRGVLEAVPNSRLLIKAIALGDPGTRSLVIDRLRRLGLPENRIHFQVGQPTHAGHLSVYHAVDVALDTFPYHGTTTTCEALWMGVPVVTRAGQAHASRVGVSLLSAVGLDDLIADSGERFVQIAKALAGDLARLSELRSSLRQRMRVSPLTDPNRLTRAVERAFDEIWLNCPI
jgi:predicted O-linked N-acetylglucosamine transferase (SPINDLY family)